MCTITFEPADPHEQAFYTAKRHEQKIYPSFPEIRFTRHGKLTPFVEIAILLTMEQVKIQISDLNQASVDAFKFWEDPSNDIYETLLYTVEES